MKSVFNKLEFYSIFVALCLLGGVFIVSLVQEDEAGNKIVKKLDGQNHEIEITDPRENITTFEYDKNNNLTKTKNALTHETVNTYDGQFRLIETKDPLNHTTGFDYDSEHHLTKATDV